MSLRSIIFLAAHIPLALLMNQVPAVGTLHALLALGVGLWFAALGRDPLKAAFVGAYIMGAEVLWRMTTAGVFWEFGKYATIAIFAVAILRFHRLKVEGLSVVYFLLLLPSAILTLSSLDISNARAQISFNLSGPLALMVCAWFFAGLKLNAGQLRELLLLVVGPVAGICTIALYSTLAAKSIQWVDDSVATTSGGFGPNQVSGMLGLGALLAFIYIWQGRANRWLQFVMFVTILVFGTQSALTFSRSGLYNAGAALAVLLLFSIKDRAALLRTALALAIVFLAVNSFILPVLERFTGGAIVTRFRDTNLTNRGDIAAADLQIWANNPLFGVGPGMARDARGLLVGYSAAHTELSRLLAEHGVFGLTALLLLLLMSARNMRRARTARERALVATMLVWTLFFMLNSAMRLVAPSFLFGLTFATIALDSQNQDTVWHPPRRVPPAAIAGIAELTTAGTRR